MLIISQEKFDDMLLAALASPVIVYDVETNGVEPFKGDRIIGVALLVPDLSLNTIGQSYYIPFRHSIGTNMPIRYLHKLAPLFKDKSKVLIGFNLKFDIHCTEVDYIPVNNTVADVMLAAHLVNENEMSFKLKDLGAKYIDGTANQQEQDLIKLLKEKGLDKGGMGNLLPEEVAPYAEQDVILTWQLACFYSQHLETQKIYDLWLDVNEYSMAVKDMEKYGILIDIERCHTNRQWAESKRQALINQMVQMVGDFNPNSVPQLRKILGQKYTDKEALKKCNHPITALLLEYRGWNKAITTYYDVFVESVDQNNRIHPNIFIHGTISGRLSCRKPNLQALPKSKDQYNVRELVIAPPGFVLVSFDWSQVELRLLAHYTGDEFLIDTFNQNKDVHQATAEKLNIPRDIAKRINFGIVYGIGAQGLADMLGCTTKQAEKYLNDYHDLMPGIRKLYGQAQHFANGHRQIEMWTGRLRHYRDEDETHKAMSNLIQGGVAEMMRIAMTNIHEMIRYTPVEMILQIHDELLFYIPKNGLDHWVPAIKSRMEDFEFNVKIIANGKYGDRWDNTMVEVSNTIPTVDFPCINTTNIDEHSKEKEECKENETDVSVSVPDTIQHDEPIDITEIYLDSINNIDCVKGMELLPDNCIDLTITSPPYDNARKYEGFGWDFEATANELYRITKKGGVVVWVVNDQTKKGTESGTSFKQALYFKDIGFNIHDTMIYAKNNPIPLTHNRYEQAFEYMFVFSKGSPKTFNPIKTERTTVKKVKKINVAESATVKEINSAMRRRQKREILGKDDKIIPNIWYYSVGLNQTTSDKEAFQHPAIFPEQLVEDHIISWSNEGDTILDPFMGSGTTAKMAKLNNRHYIGFELTSKYCDIARNRVSSIVRDTTPEQDPNNENTTQDL